jgi:hypothetical protein
MVFSKQPEQDRLVLKPFNRERRKWGEEGIF